MTRTDQDSWDLASSVGATATMVAAARALASAGERPIIDDPFAAPLVRAVGLDFFRRLVDGEVAPADPQRGERDLQLETDSIAVRTRFFDDFFTGAARDGIRQSVILAAGLDARAYRLDWPAGAVVYEVDQPKVVEFKTNTMAALSAPGSRLATEYHPDATGTTMAQRAQEFNDRWARVGCDIDLSGLFFDGERSNVVEYLTGRGWRVSARPRRDLFDDYGLAYREDDETAQFPNIVAVSAELG